MSGLQVNQWGKAVSTISSDLVVAVCWNEKEAWGEPPELLPSLLAWTHFIQIRLSFNHLFLETHFLS